MKGRVYNPVFDFENDQTGLKQFCDYCDSKNYDFEIYGELVEVYEKFSLSDLQEIFNKFSK